MPILIHRPLQRGSLVLCDEPDLQAEPGQQSKRVHFNENTKDREERERKEARSGELSQKANQTRDLCKPCKPCPCSLSESKQIKQTNQKQIWHVISSDRNNQQYTTPKRMARVRSPTNIQYSDYVRMLSRTKITGQKFSRQSILQRRFYLRIRQRNHLSLQKEDTNQ